ERESRPRTLSHLPHLLSRERPASPACFARVKVPAGPRPRQQTGSTVWPKVSQNVLICFFLLGYSGDLASRNRVLLCTRSETWDCAGRIFGTRGRFNWDSDGTVCRAADDRRSRSLADFAKMVELFDTHQVSLCSPSSSIPRPSRGTHSERSALVLRSSSTR